MTTNLEDKIGVQYIQEKERTRMRLSGVKVHGFVRLNAGTLIPRGM